MSESVSMLRGLINILKPSDVTASEIAHTVRPKVKSVRVRKMLRTRQILNGRNRWHA